MKNRVEVRGFSYHLLLALFGRSFRREGGRAITDACLNGARIAINPRDKARILPERGGSHEIFVGDMNIRVSTEDARERARLAISGDRIAHPAEIVTAPNSCVISVSGIPGRIDVVPSRLSSEKLTVHF